MQQNIKLRTIYNINHINRNDNYFGYGNPWTKPKMGKPVQQYERIFLLRKYKAFTISENRFMPWLEKSKHPKITEKNLWDGTVPKAGCSCMVLLLLLLYGVPPPKSPVSLLCNLWLSSWVSDPPSSSPKFSLSHFFPHLCWNANVSSPPIDLSFITLGKP